MHSAGSSVLIDLFLRGDFSQRLVVSKVGKFARFATPVYPGYANRSLIPQKLEDGLISRNNSFKVEKWIVEHIENPEIQDQMYCFSCNVLGPADLNKDDFIEITKGLMDECYWYYNNYERLAMRLRVFICHAKEDKLKARDLYKRLKNDGIDVWFDEESLMAGNEWDLEVANAVRDSHIVIVLLSNGSVTKTGYVQKEIRMALDVASEQPEGGIFLIPVRLEDCKVPSRMRQYQWVDLFQKDGYSKLIEALSAKANKLGFSLSDAKNSSTK